MGGGGDKPLWPKREGSGTAPRTAKEGVEKKVLITVDVAGIVVVGLMCRLWFDPLGEVWELDFEDRCLRGQPFGILSDLLILDRTPNASVSSQSLVVLPNRQVIGCDIGAPCNPHVL